MNQDIINLLKSGKIGVLPTDTLYGLVGIALNQKVVQKIYEIKGRSPDKPFIILISSLEDLKLFNIKLDNNTKKFLEKIWPNKISVILPCTKDKFEYLHRGTETLAFRLPDDPELTNLIRQAEPLVAPSANPEGLPPAETIEEAKDYFKKSVAFYLDKGRLQSEPSTLVKIEGKQVIVLRQGAVKVPKTIQ